jgi:glycosyltransferase involved in cell wall biosynthesis
VVAAEATAWQRFRGEEVARIFWSAVQAAAPTGVPPVARPSIRRGRKAQVAVLSPLPPDRSGVADFTAASLPELGAVVDVHVFSDTASPATLEGAASLRPLSSFPALYADFDRVVGVVGNSPFHTGIFDVLLRYGGACIEHDSRMLGFYRVCLGVERAIRQAERELKRRLHEGELMSWLADENSSKSLFLGELVAAAEPLFLHSARTVRLVRERYGADAVHLPFAIHRPWPSEALTPEARAEARERLNIPTSEIAIATFGMVHPTKGPQECIWAIEMLRSWGIPANLYFVGPHSDHTTGLKSLCREIGVEPYVRFLGDADGAFVGEQLYRHYLQGVDFGIQLRTIGFGTVSAALVDCIAAGLGTVTNEDLADAVEAPDYVARVPDHLSPVLIAEALADLIDRKLHTHRSEAARRTYYDGHNFDLYARRLCVALALDVPAEASRVSEARP